MTLNAPSSAGVNAALANVQARLKIQSVAVTQARLDGWESSLMGIGTDEDAIASLRYSGHFRLLVDPILEVMFMTEPFSERIVTTYPDVAFSEGVRYGGLDAEAEKVTSYLDERWRLAEVCHDAAVWGRLYGGCATWVVTDRNIEDLYEPLDPSEEILALRNIERPFCVPDMRPETFDDAGQPTLFRLTPPQGHINAVVHVSRIVLWPGDLTPQRRRIMRAFWDMSVLQRPFDVLKRNGLVSQSAMQLIKEASLGVLKVKDLHASILSGNQIAVARRIRLFNMARAQARAIILDADKEDFSRINASFAGVADLTTSQRQEVAMAAKLPMTRLMGTSATGLSGDSGGDASERQFQKDEGAYQRNTLEPRVHKLARILLDGPESPCSSQGLAISWPDLWAPSAAESATIYSTTTTADVALIDAGVLTVEQVQSRFQPEGYQQTIDITPKGAEDDETVDPEVAAQAELEQNGGTTIGGVPTNGQPQAQLNGAEITALASIVSDVAAKKLPVDSAIALISLAYNIPEEQAKKIVGSAGTSFTVEEPLPAVAGAPGAGGAKAPPGKAPAEKAPPKAGT
jgi:phage-related protein (TIGR01555 family)